MKDDELVAQPLTAAEIEQLDEFLTSESTPNKAMDISMMDGFITALASGPNMMMPSSMLQWIWDADHGEESPTFANAAETKHVVGLIVRTKIVGDRFHVSLALAWLSPLISNSKEELPTRTPGCSRGDNNHD